jgi:hypothetical protein
MIRGGCHCGRIRYSIDLGALDDVAICHCSTCRQTTGGTHVTWATIPIATLRWKSHKPQDYASSDHGMRQFCPVCGTQLAFFSHRAADRIDITIASLESPDAFPPSRHIWTKSKLHWVSLDDRLPREEQEAS